MIPEIILGIYRQTKDLRVHGPVLKDNEYSDLVNLASRLGIVRGEVYEEGDFFLIRCRTEHPGIQEVFEFLKGVGWFPCYGYLSGGSPDHFSVRTVRSYESNELDEFEYFSSICFHNIFWVESENGLEEQGWSASGIDLDENYDHRVASLGLYNYFVRDDFKAKLEEARLTGLEFRPLRWSVTNEDTKEVYLEIQTRNIMPPCLLSVVWMDDRFQFEENGHDPAELRYSRADLEKIEPFDVAWSAEELGNPEKPNWGRRIMIFSQRFRQVALEAGIDMGALNLTPLRLV